MKKSMIAYISALTENRFELLEEIIEEKYNQFVSFYWLLKDYSDYIAELKYKETKHNILKIEVKLSGVKIDRVLNKLQKNIKENDFIFIYNDENKIKIEISNGNVDTTE